MISRINQSPQVHLDPRSKKEPPTICMFRSIGRKAALSPSSIITNFANKENTQNSQNQSNDSGKKVMKRSDITSLRSNRQSMFKDENFLGEKTHRRKISRIKPTVAFDQLSLNDYGRQVKDAQNGNKLALNLNNLHSNKANYHLNVINEKLAQEISGGENKENAENQIISEGTSKDGQYYVVSRVLKGDDLKKAVQLQYKMNNKGKRPLSLAKKAMESPRSVSIPDVQQSKTSTKENGIVKAYAVNTHQGISRKYNEDRVSIILNISKNGVKASYFAIYDGHGGSACCDFLSENLHQFILNSKKFPSSPRQALIQGIKLVQKKFIQSTKKRFKLKQELDRSGSCVLIALIVGSQIFIANLGDSRAVLSTLKGKPLYSLSRDHKPTDSNEQTRIFKEGGKIYRTQMAKKQKKKPNEKQDVVVGPLRVYPGKLSVTRTIGDIQAKDKQLGGIENCISTDPEICKYALTGKEDFIVLGCDGIYQKLDSEEVVEEIWKSIQKTKSSMDTHKTIGKAAEAVIKQCMRKKSTDNLTLIIIGLGDLGMSKESEYRSA